MIPPTRPQWYRTVAAICMLAPVAEIDHVERCSRSVRSRELLSGGSSRVARLAGRRKAGCVGTPSNDIAGRAMSDYE
jgi:hypothetical protein